ncbi:VOC family protein [Streptomyces sp. G45]|uniref:VOC family protein n=1 Tax=Streptomyces sp. G45 TaxID=3406627 RepID=UPI003C17C6B0
MQSAPFTVLAVRDVAATAAFYEKIGFRPPSAEVAALLGEAAMVTLDQRTLFVLHEERDLRRQTPGMTGQPLGASCVFTIPVPDYDATAERVRDHAEVLDEQTTDGVFRTLTFRDPNGYLVAISGLTRA